jgi:pimeloyl-ACP methyl ester carboxylesterase
MAALCNDQNFVWDRSDPVDVRRAKFRAAVAAFDPDAFAPFSVRGWTAFIQPEACLTWPGPDRFEPVVPDAATARASVPTLILAGDSDTIVPVEVVGTLRDRFPRAAFVTVAGAGHPVARAAWGDCAAQLVRQMFDALEVTDAACATGS